MIVGSKAFNPALVKINNPQPDLLLLDNDDAILLDNDGEFLAD